MSVCSGSDFFPFEPPESVFRPPVVATSADDVYASLHGPNEAARSERVSEPISRRSARTRQTTLSGALSPRYSRRSTSGETVVTTRPRFTNQSS